MIFFDNVSKIYSSTSVALKNGSIKIQPKEFVSIVGQSGAGKSTLLKLLIVEERPSEGRVFLDGEEVKALSRGELPRIRRRVGAIFQDYRLLPGKTASENVAFAMEAAGRPERVIDTDGPEALDLGGLSNK